MVPCKPCNKYNMFKVLQPLQHKLTGRIVWTLELELFTRDLAVSDPCADEEGW